MAYYFMLDTFPLPIPPSALTIKTPSLNQTVTLINDGEINIPKRQGLREISFDFLIPSVQKYPFALYHLGFLNASAWILLLKYVKENAIPFPFIVVRMSPGGKINYFTSIVVLIEDVEFKEDAEEYGLDTMCSITLKEYKPYATKRVEIKNSSANKPGTAKVQSTRDSSSKVKSSTVTPREGETVVSAAKRNGDDLVDLSNANLVKTTSVDNLDKVVTEINVDQKIDFSKWTQATYDGVDASGNVLVGGVKGTEVHSMADTLMLGSPPVKTYKAPTTSNANKTLFDMIGSAVSPGAIPF